VALANQVRGLLAEYGIVVTKGFAPLRRALPTILEDERLSSLMREVAGEIAERLRYLEDRLHQRPARLPAAAWRRTLPAAG